MADTNSTYRAFSWRTAWLCLLIIAVGYGAILTHRVTVRYGGNITGLFAISETYPLPPQLAHQNACVNRGWIGYDGQFFLFVACDPFLRGNVIPTFLSAGRAAYWYQRIGLPFLAYVLSCGNVSVIPYAMVGLNYFAVLVGSWFFLKLLESRGASPFWVLAFAFSPSLMGAEFRVLSEAMATSMVFIAIWALYKERWLLAAMILCGAVLVRETTFVFSFCVALWAMGQRQPRRALFFLAPLVLYGLWATYVHARLGVWAFASGVEDNFDWPMKGVVEKFAWVLSRMAEVHRMQGRSGGEIFFSVFVEAYLDLGLLFAIYLAVKRFGQAPREWLTLGLCAYALMAVFLGVFPWSRFWHNARVLDLLVLLPLLVYFQTRDTRFLVPWFCALPVSIAMLMG